MAFTFVNKPMLNYWASAYYSKCYKTLLNGRQFTINVFPYFVRCNYVFLKYVNFYCFWLAKPFREKSALYMVILFTGRGSSKRNQKKFEELFPMPGLKLGLPPHQAFSYC